MKNLTIHSGQNDMKGIPAGPTAVSRNVRWSYGKQFCPLNSWNKWRMEFFNEIQNEYHEAQKRGQRYELILASTAVLRKEPLKAHCFYYGNDGPVYPNSRGSGVPDFFKKYSSIKKMLDFLDLLHEKLPAAIYEDFEIDICWEIFSGWKSGGKSWSEKIIRHWAGDLKETRRIGMGTPYIRHINETEKATGQEVALYMEAWNFNAWRWKNLLYRKSTIRKKDIVYNGYWPDRRLYWGQKKTKPMQRYFTAGHEKQNAVKTIKQTARMLDYYINPSFPFEQLMKHKETWWANRNDVDISGYDTGEYKKYIETYMMSSQVRNYCNEQSIENHRALEKYTRETIEGLRSK